MNKGSIQLQWRCHFSADLLHLYGKNKCILEQLGTGSKWCWELQTQVTGFGGKRQAREGEDGKTSRNLAEIQTQCVWWKTEVGTRCLCWQRCLTHASYASDTGDKLSGFFLIFCDVCVPGRFLVACYWCWWDEHQPHGLKKYMAWESQAVETQSGWN